MTNVEIDPAVFNSIYYPHLRDGTETQIYYGGSSSGKSYFLAERCVYDLMQGKRNYLICRKVGKYVMKSVWIEVENVINAWGVAPLFAFNKSDRTITCTSKKQAIFTGLDEPQKLKSIRAQSGAITDLWVEEATEAEKADIKELSKRQRGGSDKTPKRLTLSFNPVLQTSWIYDTYFSKIGWTDTQQVHKGKGIVILKTTYKDNKFLTRQDIQRLEDETDPYFYDVYTRGNWGILGDVIFTNWRVEDLSGMADQFTNPRHGLDFGYASDPAALVVSHYDTARGIIYVYGEMYQTGLTNPDLAKEIINSVGENVVTCDSAEPKSIVELANCGVSASGAKKGKDSVHFGIQWLQGKTIVIDKSCINMRNELQQYHWKKDAGGNSLPVPVDKNNHLIDALRYAYEGDMLETWWTS